MMSESVTQPRIIGLLGGVASGKSFVAEQLQKFGAAKLDADRVGHEVLLLPEVEAALKSRWGEQVIGREGRISRSAVAAIVFARTDEGRRELAFLESVTHPLIGVRLREEAQRLSTAGFRYLVLDAPVMLKAGWDSLCDVVLYVDAPQQVRLERALSRGWTPEEFAAREAAQESLETKRRRADAVIENGGKPEETAARLARWWQEFTTVVE
jgi:dephospho-CoA kinase